MEIPNDVKVHDFASSHLWISKEGIVYSSPKTDAYRELSHEEIKMQMDNFRTIIGNKKVCIVLESNPKAKPTKKEQRDFIASELSSVVKAMALITSSPASRIIANLFFGFKPPAYPVKMFSDEAKATEWIKQYL